MENNRRILFQKIIYTFSVFYHLFIGIGIFVFALSNFEITNWMLAILILLSSVPHFLLYLVEVRRTSYLIIGLVGLVLGIMFLSTNLFTVDQICMIWGSIDICRGITEIINFVQTSGKNKLQIIEIFVSIGDIVIGVLLCIHLSSGLKTHLFYLAISFLIIAIEYVMNFAIMRKRKNV